MELFLIVIGIGFTVGSGTAAVELRYLVAWDLLALSYLAVGVVVLRRQRAEAGPLTGPAGMRGLRLLGTARFNFAFTLAASIVGMTSASVVISEGDAPGVGADIRFFGTIAIGSAWILLHAGYARFYAGLYYRRDQGGGVAGGLDFPGRESPGPDDFMYFAFALGTSFAVSDVTVTSSALRWHVMVHSVLSFFYNAVVLALAISILTGR